MLLSKRSHQTFFAENEPKPPEGFVPANGEAVLLLPNIDCELLEVVATGFGDPNNVLVEVPPPNILAPTDEVPPKTFHNEKRL